jgi:hypothetical protein
MAGRQGAFGQHLPHFIGKFQQAQRIGDVAAAFTDDFAQVVLGIAILRNQLLIALRLFKRVEIRTLDIFDNSDLESGPVIDIPHDDRNIHQAGHLSGTPAPFTRDDFVSVVTGAAHHNRLHDSVLPDRPRQVFKIGRIEAAARIARIAADMLDRHQPVS